MCKNDFVCAVARNGVYRDNKSSIAVISILQIQINERIRTTFYANDKAYLGRVWVCPMSTSNSAIAQSNIKTYANSFCCIVHGKGWHLIIFIDVEIVTLAFVRLFWSQLEMTAPSIRPFTSSFSLPSSDKAITTALK